MFFSIFAMKFFTTMRADIPPTCSIKYLDKEISLVIQEDRKGSMPAVQEIEN